jgi:hypothetical protein
MTTFIKAAKSFKYADGSNIFVGPVVVSDKCIFLTCNRVIGVDKALKRNLGAAGAVLSKLVEKEADPFDYSVQIPEETLNDQNWPISKDIQSAIIINREDAEKVSYPFWGSLNVFVNGIKFNILSGFSLRKKIINLLKANNWNL